MFGLAADSKRYFMVGAFFGDIDDRENLDFAVRAYSVLGSR